MNQEQLDREAGAAVYTPRTLGIYDLVVHGFSNRFLWKVPTTRLVEFYNGLISANHLDVGVGSGYFLEKCRFPMQPRLALMDLNRTCLQYAAQRVAKYRPNTHQVDVFEPIDWEEKGFNSICLGYLLHCLPGAMKDKAVVFDNLKPLLLANGVLFGATILGEDQSPNWGARRLMKIYNKKGVFSNMADNEADLREILATRFETYSVEVVGHVALFWAQGNK
ncbi:methyltransferase [Polycladidibacter stylochi]|uniref:methyltransferase n=1 Tax=Polycladidibacter stylochi TaxID=1807766 RepID=UPI00082A5993|nr:class I SAM-dependent methyltransferase [Pseudovibrio stylochi]